MPLDLQTASPRQVLECILADGIVDADEVETLKSHIGRDWRIDRDEAELMLEINRAGLPTGQHAAGWRSLFVEALTRYVVFDLNTPGEVDPEEGDWLGARLELGAIGETELALMREIRKTASKVSGRLSGLMARVGEA
jgi:hypothetical protein